MAEKQAYQEVETIETALIDVELTRKQVMDKFSISSLNTLKRWCSVVGIECGSKFQPEDLAKLAHLHHHISLDGMTMADYSNLIKGESPKHEVNQTHGRYKTSQETQHNYDSESSSSGIEQVIKQRYGGALNAIADSVADGFWHELDQLVLQKISNTAHQKQGEKSLLEKELTPRLALGGNHQSMWLLPPGCAEIEVMEAE